jgi:ketosteroid isomerase-like protein
MDDAAVVIGRLEGWQAAIERRDVAAAGEYLDDDFALVIVQPAPTFMPRAQWLALLPEYFVTGYEVQERIIDVDGDLALVLQRVHMDATVRGMDRSGTFVLTDAWRRSRRGWHLWRRHSTPLTAGTLPSPR